MLGSLILYQTYPIRSVEALPPDSAGAAAEFPSAGTGAYHPSMRVDGRIMNRWQP